MRCIFDDQKETKPIYNLLDVWVEPRGKMKMFCLMPFFKITAKMIYNKQFRLTIQSNLSIFHSKQQKHFAPRKSDSTMLKWLDEVNLFWHLSAALESDCLEFVKFLTTGGDWAVMQAIELILLLRGKNIDSDSDIENTFAWFMT